MTEAARISQLPEATPISRLLRAGLGIALLSLVAPALLSAPWWWRGRVAGIVIGLIVLYTVVHAIVSRYLRWLHPWAGAVFAVTPAVLIAIQGDAYEVAVVLFIGLSLVLIAAIGHPGCEVLAFPALFLGRRTHLACILFSPLDWIEARVTALVVGGFGDR